MDVQSPCFWMMKKPPEKTVRPSHTPLKFNIAPEKWWLEDYFPIGKVYNFSGASCSTSGGYPTMGSWGKLSSGP